MNEKPANRRMYWDQLTPAERDTMEAGLPYEGTQMYERTVTAALSETKSRFALAEALAEDIPARAPGTSATARGTRNVLDLIKDAGDAIVSAGGEPRTCGYLAAMRETALWVSSLSKEGSSYNWVRNMSFTSHKDAWAVGEKYEVWAANPHFRVLPTNEHSPSKAETIKELLADPIVQQELLDDPVTREQIQNALDDHVPAPRPEKPRLEINAAASKLGDELVRYLPRKASEFLEHREYLRPDVRWELARVFTSVSMQAADYARDIVADTPPAIE